MIVEYSNWKNEDKLGIAHLKSFAVNERKRLLLFMDKMQILGVERSMKGESC